ncbi:hypothetical protein PHJA_003033500 [Phtheirospermum japonicum]|uniref:Uncharacterized protein n=1 Tax=Phtheirospermum japonicum TaxID=374723 RepID=A0A830DNT6_9LAMI|nr:hypothetical protein PHJA_003033500 [Phtheirospermum japonicum]
MVTDRQLEAASEDGDRHGVLLSMAAGPDGLDSGSHGSINRQSDHPLRRRTNKATMVRGNNGQQQNGSGGVAWLESTADSDSAISMRM